MLHGPFPKRLEAGPFYEAVAAFDRNPRRTRESDRVLRACPDDSAVLAAGKSGILGFEALMAAGLGCRFLSDRTPRTHSKTGNGGEF